MALGERGEKFAARYLRRQGYKILVRRFKGRGGEIDLVCRHKDWLVFVEVKTRKSEQYGSPSESVRSRSSATRAKRPLITCGCSTIRKYIGASTSSKSSCKMVRASRRHSPHPKRIRLERAVSSINCHMLAKVHSAAVLGINAFPVKVEVNSGWDNRRSSSSACRMRQ